MKKLTLNYLFIGLGFTLILLGWFISSVYYEVAVNLYFAIVLLSMVVLTVFIPLIRWLFCNVSKTYTIKKGGHYSGFRFKPFIKKSSQSVDVTFHEGCNTYEKGNDQLNEQINKLFGFGDILHHNNSNRIGWRYNNLTKKIDLFNYMYDFGELKVVGIGDVLIGQKIRIDLKSPTYWFGVNRFPYFGGKSVAPNDIKITLTYK